MTQPTDTPERIASRVKRLTIERDTAQEMVETLKREIADMRMENATLKMFRNHVARAVELSGGEG